MGPREPEGPTAEEIGLDPSTVIQRSPLDPPSDLGPPVSMSDQLPSREEVAGVWPFTWCEVHFAGAVEKMTGCLVWVERGLAGAPDCILVDRLLVDREAIDYEAAVNVLETRLASSAYDDTEDDTTVRLMFAAGFGDTE